MVSLAESRPELFEESIILGLRNGVDISFQHLREPEKVVDTNAADGLVVYFASGLSCGMYSSMKECARVKSFQESQSCFIHEFCIPPRRPGRLPKSQDQSAKANGYQG